MIEINIIYGLIFAILTLVLSGGFLFSKAESRDEIIFTLFAEDLLPISERNSRFKLTTNRRYLLKALFLDFHSYHK